MKKRLRWAYRLWNNILFINSINENSISNWFTKK